MEAYRFIVRPNGNRLEIVLPDSLVNQEVEIIILPAEEKKVAVEPIRQLYEKSPVAQYTHKPVSKEEALEYLVGCLED